MAVRRVTRSAWFGPKRIVGWGWTARTWQGWVVSVVFVVAIVASALARYWVLSGALLVAFVLVVVFTGDPPGGPRSGGRSDESP